ncbi:hypothetical protein [Tunturiibacter psychrotolerans]|uniref:hypothetical protein n=1 Tax=Tunturiibacter psychrotolerans TaxID=3069686 RepID=UPI003D254232
MTMRFPVELVVRDAQMSIDEGHVAVFGSMQNQAKEHELASRCMKPILLADLPGGSPQENPAVECERLNAVVVRVHRQQRMQGRLQVQGRRRGGGRYCPDNSAASRSDPYKPPTLVRLRQAEAPRCVRGFRASEHVTRSASCLIAMAAMRYHGHILGWLMSAGQLNTFNDLTKTSIELDDGKTYALVPFNLDDHLRLPKTS